MARSLETVHAKAKSYDHHVTIHPEILPDRFRS